MAIFAYACRDFRESIVRWVSFVLHSHVKMALPASKADIHLHVHVRPDIRARYATLKSMNVIRTHARMVERVAMFSMVSHVPVWLDIVDHNVKL
jgi:hypothetical protein